MYFTLAAVTAIWTTLFFAFKLQLSSESASRAVSLVHSVLATLLAGSVYMKEEYSGLGTETTKAQRYVLLFSITYFLYDTIIGLQQEILELHFTLHHIIAVASLMYGVIYRISGWELVTCLFFAEASNPFYHLLFLLRNLSSSCGFLYVLVLMAFLTIFLVCRMYLSSVLILSVVLSRYTSRCIKTMGIGMLIINTGFAYVLIQQIFCYLNGGQLTLG
ncbi:aspartate aminotransferase [Perkinsela sp. CCAP 1560/4]|nr:aspartate aminotransferase [Perkinsela sp. CCAP 1560/4]|eukprot:KNH06203.1 aspartate aminotransferase [Perkinsela sp. CCAP 1560/4]